MPRTMKLEGLEEAEAMLAKLGDKAAAIASAALYEGVVIVANAYNAEIDNIKTKPFKYAAKGQTRLPSPEEVEAIRSSGGVARFRKEGSVVGTSISVNDGYATLPGRRGKGERSEAKAMIAASINSGTSFMSKQPFVRKAENASRGAASAAIEAKVKELVDKVSKE